MSYLKAVWLNWIHKSLLKIEGQNIEEIKANTVDLFHENIRIPLFICLTLDFCEKHLVTNTNIINQCF